MLGKTKNLFLGALFWGLTLGNSSAQTPAVMHNQINTQIVSGIPGGITAFTLNQILNNLVNSYSDPTNIITSLGYAPLNPANNLSELTSYSAAFNRLSPMTAAGDLIYGGASGAGTRLPAGTSTQVLISGTTPTWGSVNIATMVSGLGAGVATAAGIATNANGGFPTVSVSATAPSVPAIFQPWLDTSASPSDLWKVSDGISWINVAEINTTLHTITLPTLNLAATPSGGFGGVSGNLPIANMPVIAGDTILGNGTAGSATPTALSALPSTFTGTSGHVLPYLDGANSWGAAQTINNLVSTQLPGLSSSVQATGIPGLDGGHWFIWNNPAGFDATDTLRVDRHVLNGSGTGGVTYRAFWAYGESGPNNAGYEWTILGQQDDYSLAQTGSQNVASAGSIFKKRYTSAAVATTGASGTGATATVTFSGGATMQVGSTVLIAGMTPAGYNGKHVVTASAAGSVSFASTTTGAQTVAGTILNISVSHAFGNNAVCEDDTGENNPIAGCIANEFDIYVRSPEGDATTDTNQQRVAISVFGSGGAAGTHIAQAFYIRTDANATFDRIFRLGGTATYGLDSSGATITAPVVMAAGQFLVFDATQSGVTDTYNRYIYFSGGELLYHTQNGNVAGYDDNGSQRIDWASAIPAGGTAGLGLSMSSTANFGIYFGSGVPTLSAAQGSLYLRSDGNSTSTRVYVNTDGTTGWTSLTSAL